MPDQFLPQTALRNRDRLLPSQSAMRQFYQGSAFYEDLEQVTTSVLPVQSVQEKFDIRLKPGVSYETLGSDLSTLHFLQLLVRLIGASQVLEIGTYVGVSALFLAEAVGPDGRVVTVEAGQEFCDLAQANFERNGLDRRIRLINANIGSIVEDLEWYIEADLIFLDGAKEDYGRLVGPLLKLLRPGGLLVVDDVFCNGDSMNGEPATEKGQGVRDLLRQVAELEGHSPVILPFGNGLLLLRKPSC